VLVTIFAFAAVDSAQVDADVLLELFKTSDGPHWRQNSNWGRGDPCIDSWYGVRCAGKRLRETGGESEVVFLGLNSNYLRGSLPNSLANLSNLVSLFADSNPLLGGSIPAGIFSLPNLETINLRNCSLSGTLPNAINAPILDMLLLGENSLVGTLPQNWIAPQLVRLFVHHNRLSGTLPASIGNLTQLHFIEATHNSLSGTLPPEWMNLRNLEALHLSHNQLTGRVPPEWGALNALRGFYISDNRLTSLVEFPRFGVLRLFHADNNVITGPMPDSWGGSYISDFGLTNNSITGGVPRSFVDMTNRVRRLALAHNQITGPFDAALAPFFRSLTIGQRRCDLEDNPLTKPVPDFVASSCRL